MQKDDLRAIVVEGGPRHPDAAHQFYHPRSWWWNQQTLYRRPVTAASAGLHIEFSASLPDHDQDPARP